MEILLNTSFDCIIRHVVCLCLGNNLCKLEVIICIRSAFFYCNGNFTSDNGKYLTLSITPSVAAIFTGIIINQGSASGIFCCAFSHLVAFRHAFHCNQLLRGAAQYLYQYSGGHSQHQSQTSGNGTGIQMESTGQIFLYISSGSEALS